mgnify:CR=1 FL=1
MPPGGFTRRRRRSRRWVSKRSPARPGSPSTASSQERLCRHCSTVALPRGGSACAQAEGCWVFLSVLFPPGRAAWQAYATHTRRDDPGLDAPPEEASLFFKARPADGLPLPSGGADCLLHALLPTKVASPFAGHVQAADL